MSHMSLRVEARTKAYLQEGVAEKVKVLAKDKGHPAELWSKRFRLASQIRHALLKMLLGGHVLPTSPLALCLEVTPWCCKGLPGYFAAKTRRGGVKEAGADLTP